MHDECNEYGITIPLSNWDKLFKVCDILSIEDTSFLICPKDGFTEASMETES